MNVNFNYPAFVFCAFVPALNWSTLATFCLKKRIEWEAQLHYVKNTTFCRTVSFCCDFRVISVSHIREGAFAVFICDIVCCQIN